MRSVTAVSIISLSDVASRSKNVRLRAQCPLQNSATDAGHRAVKRKKSIPCKSLNAVVHVQEEI